MVNFEYFKYGYDNKIVEMVEDIFQSFCDEYGVEILVKFNMFYNNVDLPMHWRDEIIKDYRADESKIKYIYKVDIIDSLHRPMDLSNGDVLKMNKSYLSHINQVKRRLPSNLSISRVNEFTKNSLINQFIIHID